MSVFTCPATASAEDARAYTHATLALLGDRDALQVLIATGPALRAAVAALTDTQLRTAEAPGKWAIIHVVQHLADSEMVLGWRIRLVLAQERPPLTGTDQDAWADRLGYAVANPTEALDQFDALRSANVRLLRRASREDMQRVGIHSQRGEESIEHMVRLYAGHDLLHLNQIRRIANTITGRER